jgi:hypothetical protein
LGSTSEKEGSRSGRGPSGTTVVAWLALFIALGGAAAGLPGHNSVGSRDIRNHQVRSKDLHAPSVQSRQLRNGSVHQVDLASRSVGTDQLLDGAVGPAKLGTVPAARVDTPQEDPACGTQTVDNNSSEIVRFSSELYDTQNLHDDPPADCSVGTQSRLTAPIDGIYTIEGEVTWGTDNSGRRQLEIVVTPAAGGPLSVASDYRPGVIGAATGQSTSTTIALGAGDSAELRATQTSGSALDLGTSVESYFAMTWIAPPPP